MSDDDGSPFAIIIDDYDTPIPILEIDDLDDDEILTNSKKVISITDSLEEELDKTDHRRRKHVAPIRFNVKSQRRSSHEDRHHSEPSRRNSNDETNDETNDECDSTIHKYMRICIFCDVKITSYVQSDMHYSGKPHAKKIKNIFDGMVSDDEDEHPSKKMKRYGEDLDYFFCRLCKRTFSDAYHAGRHLRDHHKDILDDIRSANEVGEDFQDEDEMKKVDKSAPLFVSSVPPNRRGKRFDCKLCMISTSSAEHLNDHYNGKIHKKRAKASNNEAVGEPIVDSKFFCDLCKIGAPSQNELANHQKGRNHTKKLKALHKAQIPDEKLNRPIPNLNIEMFNTGY